MTGQPITLTSLAEDRVRKFLRTAIIIDDRIEWEPAAQRATAAVEIVPPPFVPAKPEPQAPEPILATGKEADIGNQPVDLRALADAFLEHGIVCGVHEPIETDDDGVVIGRALKAAKSADVVIIDWFLKKTSAERTKQFLLNLLMLDQERRGHTRLVIVYTGDPALDDKSRELAEFLIQNNFRVDFDTDGQQITLKIGSCRVRFIGKSHNPVRPSQPTAIPALVFEEFTKLVTGIAPMLALATVTEMRDAAHHLISVFQDQFDPAIISHRALVGSEEDAARFILDVLLMQIRTRLEDSGQIQEALGETYLDAWIDKTPFGSNDDDAKLDDFNPHELKAAIVSASAPANWSNNKKKRLPSKTFDAVFSVAQKEAREVSKRFSRLTSLSREFEGFSPLPSGFRPTLHLGTVLAFFHEQEDPAFFLCTQPMCDSVRLSADTVFSFVSLIEIDPGVKENHHFVVRLNGQDRALRASATRPHRQYIKFSPDAETQTVRAVHADPTDPGSWFCFISDKRSFVWVGEVERLKAQRAAEELARQIGRVGLDEYEWLRQGTKIT